MGVRRQVSISAIPPVRHSGQFGGKHPLDEDMKIFLACCTGNGPKRRGVVIYLFATILNRPKNKRS
jgi:hypothetical protein